MSGPAAVWDRAAGVGRRLGVAWSLRFEGGGASGSGDKSVVYTRRKCLAGKGGTGNGSGSGESVEGCVGSSRTHFLDVSWRAGGRGPPPCRWSRPGTFLAPLGKA